MLRTSQYLRVPQEDDKDGYTNEDEGEDKFTLTSSGSSIGREKVEFFAISFGYNDFIRLFPRPRLKDFDDAMYLPVLSRSFAEKIKAIHVYANGYKLDEIGINDFQVDSSQFDPKLPDKFLPEELADQWVRLRPSNLSSAFHVSFANRTPRRHFDSPLTDDSLTNLRREWKKKSTTSRRMQ